MHKSHKKHPFNLTIQSHKAMVYSTLNLASTVKFFHNIIPVINGCLSAKYANILFFIQLQYHNIVQCVHYGVE